MSHCYSSGINGECMDQSTSYQAFKNSSSFFKLVHVCCVREANLITQDREKSPVLPLGISAKLFLDQCQEGIDNYRKYHNIP